MIYVFETPSEMGQMSGIYKGRKWEGFTWELVAAYWTGPIYLS